ncbi:hypothetical protein O3G_MSEX013192 [Manduca sexta]|uniref:Uncharacterized protein n=1 Tax=Manduca sexta TaxID=7130 RepID=A0A922CWP1_MANSE|nr:hypothetical protein O3G_MSEX013192 [Manduca sexta]
MVNKIVLLALVSLFNLDTICRAWKAIPANQAMYTLRAGFGKEKVGESDELLPRTYLHSTYKFGWCPGDATSPVFKRKEINITLPTWESTQAGYLHVLSKKHTQRFALQCIVMKAYVPKKYQFHKSRLPLYYCQGYVFMLMLNTVQRMEIHEFYLHQKLNLPVNFVFQFYHPHIL